MQSLIKAASEHYAKHAPAGPNSPEHLLASLLICIENAPGGEIEQLKKEKDALLKSMAELKVCAVCKHNGFCTEGSEGFCEGHSTVGCPKSDGCPCMNCISESHWEWRGIG